MPSSRPLAPTGAPVHRLTRRSMFSVLALAAALTGSLLVDAASTAVAGPASHDFAEPIFSTDARGDIVTIGNVSTTCNPGYANANWSAAESDRACRGAVSGATDLTRFDGAAMPPINNRLSMEHVDVDDDASTFSSSVAQLHLPAGSTVLWAGLHWNGATEVPRADQLYGSDYQVEPVDAASRFEVRMSTPAGGGYQAVDASPSNQDTSDTWDDTNPGGTVSYGAFADVTQLVQAGGSGDYTVADVQSCRGFGGCFGSWSLTVAFANRDLPPRNLNVWHGWQLTTPSVNGGAQEFEVQGITPPPRGPVTARLGVVQADGDRGLGPDSLDISSPSSPSWRTFATADRPLSSGEGDWFNSTVNAFGHRRSDADARPNLVANLNQDIALVQDDTVISNDDRSFRFRIQTASTESLYSQVVHSAVDVYEPEISIAKAVTPPGPVASGETVTWTLTVANIGVDPVRQAIVADPLPAGVTYVPGSVRYTEGGPAALLGTKTDAVGDDHADWDPTQRTLTFRVGAGATASNGGTMGLAPAPDGSDRVTITFRTVVDVPPDQAVTNVATAHGQGRVLRDPYGPLTTEAVDRAMVAAAPEADLGITKTDGDASVRAVGDRFTYGLTATNAGPSPATGVVMTDELDPRLRFVDSSDGCTAARQVVSCLVGDLAASATSERTFVVEVVKLPEPGKSIFNVAVIRGNEPNPDCIAPTPDALCNEDEEETPSPAIDLGITKTDGEAVIRRVGDTFTYRLSVTNAGPDDATGVVITDILDRRLGFVRSDRCFVSGQRVRCTLGDVAAGQRVVATMRVKVLSLPRPGQSIPNVATVRGIEPDPDCVPATPRARCNHDDERTPRPNAPKPKPIVPRRSALPPASTSTSRGPIVKTGSDVVPWLVLGAVALGTGSAVLVTRRRVAAKQSTG